MVKSSGWERRGRGGRLSGLALLAALPLLVAGSPSPSTIDGLPQQIIPKAGEVGLPPYPVPIGTVSLYGGSVRSDGSGSGGLGGTQGNGDATDGSQGDPLTSGYPGSGSGSGGGFVASDYQRFLGQSVGSGQCVALVQAASPGVGLTATWAQGDSVQGNTSLQPGTVIATFGPAGTYTNSTDGSSHAAIYLGQNADGIQVMDQWLNHPASVRTIRWDGGASQTAVNTGSAFYVVRHS